MRLTHCNSSSVGSCRQSNSVNFFDGLFDDFFRPVLSLENGGRPTSRSNPLQVDIFEQENVIIIEADLPGVDKEDITLNVKGRHLTLSGKRRYQKEREEEHQHRRERSFGNFERTFSLPFAIDPEAVTARLERGTLRLEIPKPENTKSIKISIN